MNLKPQLLQLFENKPNSAFEVADLVKELNADPKDVYRDLQYLVRSKIVTKVIPGLCGGRKNTYFKRNVV